MIKSAYISDDEFNYARQERSKFNIPTKLGVFAAHNGFRNGCIHVLVGRKGQGKSTWIKTILSELASFSVPTMLYLSEEIPSDYCQPINYVMRRQYPPQEAQERLENILVVSEVENKIDSIDKFKRSLGIGQEDDYLQMVKFLIIDNFTTSFLGDSYIDLQSKTYRDLVQIANNYNIPILILAHVSKNAKFDLFDSDMVRGSATGVNTAPFTYIIDQVKYMGYLRNFIHSEKSRNFTNAIRKTYEAIYNQETQLFEKCVEISADEYKRIRDHKVEAKF